VIACSAILFLKEFFADRFPVFDLLLNALHAFVRVPKAALLAYAATAQLSSGMQLLARGWEEQLHWQHTVVRPLFVQP
jgi:hypothetical protein